MILNQKQEAAIIKYQEDNGYSFHFIRELTPKKVVIELKNKRGALAEKTITLNANGDIINN